MTQEARVPSVDDLIALLRRLAGEELINPDLATAELDGETMVYMLSLGSLEFITLYAAIDAEYGIVPPTDGITDIDTLAVLAEKLRSWALGHSSVETVGGSFPR